VKETTDGKSLPGWADIDSVRRNCKECKEETGLDVIPQDCWQCLIRNIMLILEPFYVYKW
jgi:hypothetical protein